jgi:electron transfer flavoprotein beta subunit
MMASKKAVVPHWGAKELAAEKNDIGLNGSPTQVMKIFTPPPRPGGEALTGTPEEIARALVEKLKNLKVI